MDTIAQQQLEEIERISGADLVVGIVDPDHRADAGGALGVVREALGNLTTEVRTVVVCQNGAGGSNPASVPEPIADDLSPPIFLCSLSKPNPASTPLQNFSDAYQAVFTVCQKVGARACGVIGSDPGGLTPQWVYRLVQPVLEMGFDLVAPRYSRLKMEGLLNRSVLAPLNRALYGERIQNPMGPDFGLSGKLLQRILEQDTTLRNRNPGQPVASIASAAVCGGFQTCEAHLGVRAQPPTNWGDVSTLLAQILGPIFQDVELNAASWQRIRGSRPVPAFGTPEPAVGEPSVVDLRRMIESFQLGAQNLNEVWGLVLPPATLFELRKLARSPVDRFRMPDELWVSVVYDFVLGHRLRTISRDHLLRSLTPLYLGWIASYAIELEEAGPAETDSRLELLSAAFETKKPYLLSRWRWPDRFNP